MGGRRRFIRFNDYQKASWEISRYQFEPCHHSYAQPRCDGRLRPEGHWDDMGHSGFINRVAGEAVIHYVEDVPDVVYSLDSSEIGGTGKITVIGLGGETVADVVLCQDMISTEFWSALEEQQPHLRAIIKLIDSKLGSFLKMQTLTSSSNVLQLHGVHQVFRIHLVLLMKYPTHKM